MADLPRRHAAGGVPRVVIWEADGSPDGRHRYGDAIAARLAAAGIASTTVPLARRRPSTEELAAPVHVLSGGETSATSNRRWVRAARRSLEPVLVRARAGEAAVTGICFGAQLIAATLAGPGAVSPHPSGMEAGLAVVSGSAASGSAGSGAGAAGVVVSELHHHRVEVEAVAAVGGDVLLSNDHTEVQAFAVGPAIVGLQFHPELDPAAMRATLGAHRPTLLAHAADPAAALASVDLLADRWWAGAFDRFIVDPARPRPLTPTPLTPSPHS
ncbi:MAG TPA: hypothetical protein VIL48_09345, partial [Acidimicrobiales bacterium]